VKVATFLAHSDCLDTGEIPDKFPLTLTKARHSSKIERVLPESGPVAQLGARFHGMEEVIGSIPIRSTNYFNNLTVAILDFPLGNLEFDADTTGGENVLLTVL
jgi:hypothetical protein